MEQFSLEKYLENPSRKLVTRDGRSVRILDCNLKGDKPICIAIDDKTQESITTVDVNGHCLIDGNNWHESNFDLFFADEEPETIEIPFGAKDSEFIKDEYFIPEGCKARIEGNKVIIEKIREEELTELQKTIEEDCECYTDLRNKGKTREELREWIKCWCHRIKDLALKEVLKEQEHKS